jgi:lipase
MLHSFTPGVAESTGDSPTVLLLHGVSGHGRRMDGLVGHEASGLASRRCIAPDLRGHGESTWSAPWGLEQHLLDVAELVDHVAAHRSTGPLDVIGHSWGGLLALHLAARRPDLVGRLVLLDPAVALPDAAEKAEFLGSQPPFPTFEELLANRIASVGASGAAHAEADCRLVAVEKTNGWQLPWRRAAVTTMMSDTAWDPPRLPRPLPVLLVTAERGGFVNDTLRSSLFLSCGDLYREEMIDSGHMVYWEQLDLVATLVGTFLG